MTSVRVLFFLLFETTKPLVLLQGVKHFWFKNFGNSSGVGRGSLTTPGREIL